MVDRYLDEHAPLSRTETLYLSQVLDIVSLPDKALVVEYLRLSHKFDFLVSLMTGL